MELWLWWDIIVLVCRYLQPIRVMRLTYYLSYYLIHIETCTWLQGLSNKYHGCIWDNTVLEPHLRLQLPNASISLAGQARQSRCPYHQGVIIWFDECLLKYSNANFLGVTDPINEINVRSKQTFDVNSFLHYY